MNKIIESVISIFVVGILAVLISGLFILIAVVISTSATCKKLGYRTSTFGFPLTRYCETRLNQTDIIVPLNEAKSLR